MSSFILSLIKALDSEAFYTSTDEGLSNYFPCFTGGSSLFNFLGYNYSSTDLRPLSNIFYSYSLSSAPFFMDDSGSQLGLILSQCQAYPEEADTIGLITGVFVYSFQGKGSLFGLADKLRFNYGVHDNFSFSFTFLSLSF